MNGILRQIVIITAALFPATGIGQTIDEIINFLQTREDFAAQVKYTATLPKSDDDVSYEVTLQSLSATTDSLLSFDYLTRWTSSPESNPGVDTNFAAYFSGNHYRYQNGRLKEFHHRLDPIPFMVNPGIQSSSPFIELYPHMLGAEIRKMLSDSHYTLSLTDGPITDGKASLKILASMEVNGEVGRRTTFIFDKSTLLPLEIFSETCSGYSEGQTSEAIYTYPDSLKPFKITEETLISSYPEIFSNLREENMNVDNMKGKTLPTFSLPSATGERYTHYADQNFATPVMLLFFDPADKDSRQWIADFRQNDFASDTDSPLTILYISTSSNIDAAEEVVPSLRPQEYLLINGHSFERKCGIKALPLIIFADREGVVKKIVSGVNLNIQNIVNNSTTTLK